MGRLLLTMHRPVLLSLALLLLGGQGQAEVQYGPLAVANHQAGPTASCDPDFGWLPGPDGSNKCYMLIKTYDSNLCLAVDGAWGMSWFDAMQCCYYQHGYLAEPTSQEEQDKIKQYLLISNGGDKMNTWWIGGTDMHREGAWRWMSGAPWSFAPWAEGEPNQKGNEDCTAMDPQDDYEWMDLDCETGNHGVPHYVVCEKILA